MNIFFDRSTTSGMSDVIKHILISEMFGVRKPFCQGRKKRKEWLTIQCQSSLPSVSNNQIDCQRRRFSKHVGKSSNCLHEYYYSSFLDGHISLSWVYIISWFIKFVQFWSWKRKDFDRCLLDPIRPIKYHILNDPDRHTDRVRDCNGDSCE